MGLYSILEFFDTYNSRSEGTSKNHIFTNVSHVLGHNNIYLNDNEVMLRTITKHKPILLHCKRVWRTN